MQYQFENGFQSLGARHATGVAGLWQKLNARYRHYLVYSRTLAELRTLSDRDLADLGMAWADLPTIARKAADAKVKM